ncbi:hypothetical protein J4414_00035 [Candidatus Woesearchaeota archaeon]|nr:hypothetical protein [Candidatus Woesearchaeota archaeon]
MHEVTYKNSSSIDKSLLTELKAYNSADRLVSEISYAREDIIEELGSSMKRRNFNYTQWERDLITITDHLYDALFDKYLKLRRIIHKQNALPDDSNIDRFLFEMKLTVHQAEAILNWSFKNQERTAEVCRI